MENARKFWAYVGTAGSFFGLMNLYLNSNGLISLEAIASLDSIGAVCSDGKPYRVLRCAGVNVRQNLLGPIPHVGHVAMEAIGAVVFLPIKEDFNRGKFITLKQPLRIVGNRILACVNSRLSSGVEVDFG